MKFMLPLAAAAAFAQTMPEAHFHHLHLNVTDPAASVDFYTTKFDAEKGRFAGAHDAVWAQKSWLLFEKGAAPPPSEILSAIWHFGWGAEDMKAAYAKQLASGTMFDTPITELFPGFFYAYVLGPNKAVIELNTAKHHQFGHLHLLSADAPAAGEWYVKYFGTKWASGRPPTREPRFIRGYQIGPSASMMADNVNVIIFPIQYAGQQWPEQWKGRTSFVTPKGRVVDHVAFSFENLDAALAIFQKDGVKVVAAPAEIAGTKVRSAFIEGPDNILIELVEGHAKKE